MVPKAIEMAEVNKDKEGLRVKADRGVEPLTRLGECPVPIRGTEGCSKNAVPPNNTMLYHV
jgi:hypothetical protein